jgi:hypothetical protein
MNSQVSATCLGVLDPSSGCTVEEVCVCVCVYIYIYVYICVCVYIYIYIYIYVYTQQCRKRRDLVDSYL